VLDGVFTENEDGVVAFREATDLTPDHWQTLQRTVRVRVLRYFRRHGLLKDTTTADMLTWQGTGAFSIDASVRIEGDDRHGIERLGPSPSTVSMPRGATMRTPHPRHGSSTGYPGPPPTAGPSSFSPSGAQAPSTPALPSMAYVALAPTTAASWQPEL
jgi:hypothetical protein